MRQPRRLVFGSGPLPDGSPLELVEEPPAEALARLAREGVQSLLLEGGPTLAASFLRDRLVDKLLVFVAPVLSGAGPHAFPDGLAPATVHGLEAERVGEDVLLTGYSREP